MSMVIWKTFLYFVKLTRMFVPGLKSCFRFSRPKLPVEEMVVAAMDTPVAHTEPEELSDTGPSEEGETTPLM